MQENLLQQGVELMIYGMGTVFVFLVVLIVLTTVMSNIVMYFSADVSEPIMPATRAITGNSNNSDEQLLAVITAAVHKYRSRHKQ